MRTEPSLENESREHRFLDELAAPALDEIQTAVGEKSINTLRAFVTQTIGNFTFGEEGFDLRSPRFGIKKIKHRNPSYFRNAKSHPSTRSSLAAQVIRNE